MGRNASMIVTKCLFKDTPEIGFLTETMMDTPGAENASLGDNFRDNFDFISWCYSMFMNTTDTPVLGLVYAVNPAKLRLIPVEILIMATRKAGFTTNLSRSIFKFHSPIYNERKHRFFGSPMFRLASFPMLA